MYDRCSKWGPDQWVHFWQHSLKSSGPKALLAGEGGRLQLSVQLSTMKHPYCGLGLFAGRPFWKGELVGWYCGLLVFSDLRSRGAARDHYREGTLKFAVSTC